MMCYLMKKVLGKIRVVCYTKGIGEKMKDKQKELINKINKLAEEQGKDKVPEDWANSRGVSYNEES